MKLFIVRTPWKILLVKLLAQFSTSTHAPYAELMGQMLTLSSTVHRIIIPACNPLWPRYLCYHPVALHQLPRHPATFRNKHNAQLSPGTNAVNSATNNNNRNTCNKCTALPTGACRHCHWLSTILIIEGEIAVIQQTLHILSKILAITY